MSALFSIRNGNGMAATAAPVVTGKAVATALERTADEKTATRLKVNVVDFWSEKCDLLK